MDRRQKRPSPLARAAGAVALTLIVAAIGCAGPPIPAPIEGLPLCPDFTTGNAKMEGGLRFPVRLRVLDGKTVLFKTVIAGLRRPDDPKPRTFIADDNARYTVEWAQCSNPRAPRSAEAGQGAKAREKARDGRDGEATAYECGEAVVYKADGVLETKKGDRASHVINFLPPPEPACWVGEVAPPPAPAARDAGAEPPAPPAATDAGVAADAAAAPPADAGAPAAKADAGAR